MTEYIFDIPLEKSRRLAWAKFFGVRKALDAEELRSLELALWIESLDPPSGHPAWEQVAAVLDGHKDFTLNGIRRYIDYRTSLEAS